MNLLADLRTDVGDELVAISGTITDDAGLVDDLRTDISDDGAVVASGGVTTPSVSTDNAIVRWDGITGEQIQNSLATLDDNGNIITPGGIKLNGYLKRNIRIVTAGGNIAGTPADDIIMVNKTIGAATIVILPSSPGAGRMVVVKDSKGDAFTNNITIRASAGTIDGLNSFVITQNYQAFTFVYNGTEWNVI